jgi:ribonuclease E
MLENEPNDQNQAADQAASAPTEQSAAPVKKTTRKRTVKKAGAQVAPAEPAVSTQSDAAAADPAPAPVKKAAAKRTAKKTAAKRPAKKAVAQPEGDLGEETLPAATPVKKTTRKRAAKKTAAPQPDLLTRDNAVTDGPVVSADAPPASQNPGTQNTATQNPGTHNPGTQNSGTENPGAQNPGTQKPAAEASEVPAAEAVAETGQRRSRRRAPAATVLFQAPIEVLAQAAGTSPVEAIPEPSTAEPERPAGRRTRRRTAEPEATVSEPQTDAPAEAAADEQPASGQSRSRRRGRRVRDAEEVAADRAEPVLNEVKEQAVAAEDADEETDEDGRTVTDEADGDDAEGTRRRRRRRGGRRRRKAGDADGAEDNADEGSEDGADDDEHEEQHSGSDAEAEQDQSGDVEDEVEGSSSSRRRRRRRRRKGEDSAAAADDPDEIVVRVREPRSKNTANEITAVEGSTRLEAKKQRRREGRAAGRRRAPIVTEAEFLARRESVERTMVIRAREDLTQIAVSEDNVLVEHYVAQAEQSSLIGNVYLGRVQNVLPSMEAAFIDIGKGRNAVLYAGEVDWSTLGAGNGPRKIESVLKSGQAVLVQVTKDPIGHKGARLTNQISLPGRYVVYVPRGGNGGISRKLPDTERNRLKGILKDIVPDEAGVIVRTAAEGASEEELTADVSRLQQYWEDIDKKSKSGQVPQLLYGEPDLLIRVVRDLFTEDFSKLVISGDEAYDLVKEYVSYVAPHLADRVEKWNADSSGDVFSNYRIDEQIKKALDRKVWLPSGGSLIIDRTEAMTVVDVNTGKFTGSGGNLEETVTKNNLEAAEEIVRQLRLRDIGGIIVIDFIDMVLELNRDLVLRRLVECLGRDRTKHQVAEVTSLGLVQMTRKRIGTGLLEAFSENCDHCGGRGLTLHDEPRESRRRSDGESGRGRGGNSGGENKSSGDNGTGGGEGGAVGGGKATKSSRSGRNRGKGRGRGDSVEDQQPETPNDAAQRLAEIAAATSQHDRHDHHDGDDHHETDQHEAAEQGATDRSDSDRSGSDQSGSDQSGSDQDGAEQNHSDQHGAEKNGTGRRRRNSRSNASNGTADNDEGDTRADASEFASTPV